MGNITYAIAQVSVAAGDIQANVHKHLRFMRQAATHGVQMLLFPELSLTGYEPALARELAIDPSDIRIQSLRDFASANEMLTVVGAPVHGSSRADIQIAALILGADGQTSVYTKQHLHPGEEQVFTAGTGGAILGVDAQQIALAVCAPAPISIASIGGRNTSARRSSRFGCHRRGASRLSSCRAARRLDAILRDGLFCGQRESGKWLPGRHYFPGQTLELISLVVPARPWLVLRCEFRA